jgi:carbon-monoxide dehydrogenase large subunit
MTASSGDDEIQGRVEDLRLITGRGRYVDDLKLDNQAYLGIVRSPYAHAKIKLIDFSKARKSPDFISSLTGEDLLKEGVLPITQGQWPPQRLAKRYHLAVDKVRFAGEPVAAILTKNKNSLEDLIEEVEVEYEPLPTVTTVKESKEGKVILYKEWKSNLSLKDEVKKGNAEKAISSAAYVINAREGIARQASAPIETRSVLVTYGRKKDVYEVWATVQSVHGLQELLASELQVPKEKFHVRAIDVGGGFGSKGSQSYPEPLLACLFARKTGHAVKWTATRTEELLEAASGRDEYCDITLACDKDGKIVALKARVECDAGVSGTQNHMSSLTLWMMPGPYKIPNLDLKVAVYVTNKGPLGPVRGAGAPEGCFFIERAVDIMARKIGLDSIEFRRRNIIQPDEFPYDNGIGSVYDGANYPLLLDTLVQSSSYKELVRWRSDTYSRFREGSRSANPVVGGLGVSLKIQGTGAMLTETARVVLDEVGNVTVYTGSMPHGQGLQTTLAQLASEELDVPLHKVTVVWGDTDLIHDGIGTFASRSAVTGGSSVVDATRKLKSKLIARASKILKIDEKLLDLRNEMIVNASRPDTPLLTLKEIMKKLQHRESSASSKFKLNSMTYSSSVHLCALTLDVETCKVNITKYVVVEDCGRMINKAIVEGQLHGGVVHGIGGALLERLVYDNEGNPLASTFMDYNIPSALETPNIEIFHQETPSTITLNSAKGVGESGTIASYPAVINALNDALTQMGTGIEVNVAPATPDAIFSALTANGTPARPST